MSNKFELQKLNSGGFARIYLDNHDQTKIFKINKKQQDGQDQIDTLRNEIQIYQELKKHNVQNVVKYIEHFENENFISVRLDKCDCDISTFQKVSCLSIYDVIKILFSVTNALQQIHKIQIIHCDIKPSNMLLKFDLGGKFEVQLCDFGLSQIKDSIGHQLKGTNGFIDPQVVWKGIVSYGSDLWSLGISLLFIIFDKNNIVFDEKNKKIQPKMKNFNLLKVKKIKNMKEIDINYEITFQKYITDIIESIQNKTLQQLITPLLVVDMTKRTSSINYYKYLKEILQQNKIVFSPISMQRPLSLFNYITYMKIFQNMEIYITNNNKLTFKSQGESQKYVTLNKKSNLFYNDKSFLDQNQSIIKDMILKLKYPQKCKTQIIDFCKIQYLMNINFNSDNELFDFFVGLLTDGQKKYIFAIQINEKKSYYVEIQNGNYDNLSDNIDNKVICSLKNMYLITTLSKFINNNNNQKIFQILDVFYKEFHSNF